MGFVAGDYQVIAIDIDAWDGDIVGLIKGALPCSPMAKRGAKGETLFFRCNSSIKTKQYRNADGTLLVEILGKGRQTVVPPSIHPDTGQPYELVGKITRADELRILDRAIGAAFMARWRPSGARPHRP